MGSKRAREAGDFILVCLTVLLLHLSFPGGAFPWLGWLAFVPLGIAIHGKTPGDAFVISGFTTFLCWFATTWWLIPGVSESANTPFNITLFFEFVFCLVYAVPYGIAGLILAKMRWSGTILGAVKTALLWTAISGLAPHILPGNLAHTQYRYPRIIQIVELGGIPLLLCFIYLVIWLTVAAIVNLKKRPKYALGAFLLAAMVPIGMAVYGHFRLSTVRQQLTAPETPSLTVGWIQPNFTVQGRDRNAWETGVATVESMTRTLAGDPAVPDLIVWPEIPPPVSYSENADDRALIDRLVTETGIPMLVTGHIQSPAKKDHYYNAIELVREPGNADTYLKQRLLPFGEYLPGEKQFPFLRKLFPGALKYTPGTESKVLPMGKGVKLIPLICYEAIFPELVANGVALGGGLIINPVNDSWFGTSAGPEIHLALALFRTVEFRTPIVRATNSGISTAITAAGELDDTSITPLFEQCTATATVAIPQITTLYSKAGDLFLWVCALGALLWIGIDTRQKRSNRHEIKRH